MMKEAWQKRLIALVINLLVLAGSVAVASAWTTYSVSMSIISETREFGRGGVALSVRGPQDARSVLLEQEHAAFSALFVQMLDEGKGILEGDGYVIEAELLIPFTMEDGQSYSEASGVYNLLVTEWPFEEETAPSAMFVSAEDGIWKSLEEYPVPLSDGGEEEEASAPAEQPEPVPAAEPTPTTEPAPRQPAQDEEAKAPSADSTADSPVEAQAQQPGAEPIEAEDQQLVEAEPQETTKEAPPQEPVEEAPHVQVQFVDFDGFILSQIAIPAGESVSKPESDPKQQGMRFAYWHNNNGKEDTPFAFGTGITEDITLKAHYEKAEDKDGAMEEPEEEPIPEETSEWKRQLTEAGDERLDNLSIKVNTKYRSNLKVGDPITLEGVVENAPGDMPVRYQWQNDQGGSYKDVPGATGLSYTFESTPENLQCRWRLVVVLDSPSSPET